MENIEQEIKKRIEGLPADIRALVESSDLDKQVQIIAAKNQLHIDQQEKLQDEVLLVMLGFTPLEDFTKELERELGIVPEKAQAVANAVNVDIFLRIRESMKAQAKSMETASVSSSAAIRAATSVPSAGDSKVSSTAVMMPSSVKPASIPTPPAPTPSGTPIAASIPATPAPVPLQPAATPNLSAADTILSEKKVTPPAATPPPAPAAPAATAQPKTNPAQPQPYKADPYREPVE